MAVLFDDVYPNQGEQGTKIGECEENTVAQGGRALPAHLLVLFLLYFLLLIARRSCGIGVLESSVISHD